jgi:hypothetical protein
VRPWVRWERYWFADGGRYSLAILRIAVAIAVWKSLTILQGTWPASAPGGVSPSELYRPIGPWLLAGHYIPGRELIDVLWIVAKVATVAMAIGLVSRVATVISFVAATALASLYFSGSPSWSHEHNVVFLAQLALLGGRTGDALSADALIRRLRRLPPRDEPGAYQWSIRLAQIAIALMFASGMFHKVWRGAPSLAWVFSDSLRHHLLVQFDARGMPRTAVGDWLLQSVWRYRTAAMLNLISQTLPLVGCFLVRRPLLRLACGCFFVLETLGLAFVMDLWNLHWLPLAVVFVDWEWLIGLVRRTRPARSPSPPLAGSTRRRRAASAYIIAFLALDVYTSFWRRVDQQLGTYPFTGFPMFATIRARKPYSEHLPYSYAAGHVALVASQPVAPSIEELLDRAYSKSFRVRDREQLHLLLEGILGHARQLHPSTTGVRLYYTILEVPAYPAPARVDRRLIALLGELDTGGTFHSLLGRARKERDEILLAPGEPVSPGATLEYYVDGYPEPHPLAASGGPPWRIKRPPGRTVTYVVVDGDRRWVIAEPR